MTSRVITQMEDAMRPQAQHSEFQGWQRLVGRWATEGFSQRFTGTLSDDDNAINGQGELSRDDGATWEHDLAITYRRTG